MKDPILTQALHDALKGKYDKAITRLECEIVRYRDSFRFYYLLSLSCLYSGDYGRAYTYFRSANEVKNKDTNVMLGIAAINVKRGESARAVDLYLKILDDSPNNKIASRALAALRKYVGNDSEGEGLSDWMASGQIKKIFPPFPKEDFSIKSLILLCASVFVIAFGILIKTNVIQIDDIIKEKELREGFVLSELANAEKKDTLELGGAYQSILTESEVLNIYESARKLFNNYDDNRARVEINKIMLSNATVPIKNKAQILLHYIDENVVTFDNLKTNYDWAQVSKDPALYAGCYVKWTGMATNIQNDTNETTFDFLVGYEDKRKLDGQVRVSCPFAAKISSEAPLEILARVVSVTGSFSLEGATIYQGKI
jgi:tetratricopeptide (TPR) repeat protein